jgi:hypothetical protein
MKIRRYGVAGQGHGMPCPCENMVAQHIDIEQEILFSYKNILF